MRELLVLVLCGAQMSSKKRRMVKYESSKFIRVEEFLVMR